MTKFALVYHYRVLAHSGLSLKDQLPGEPVTLGEALMAPTVIYVKQVDLKCSFAIMCICVFFFLGVFN